VPIMNGSQPVAEAAGVAILGRGAFQMRYKLNRKDGCRHLEVIMPE
jgi:hypothetical protein